ncbi:hypothetical protein FB451DRAFT_1380132 [Mycena latifolia]|nr:hypothetical protein FB451DRAFT_1380132 [Mycena latifolia]
MAKTLKGHSVRPMKRGFGMHERKGQGTDLSLHQRRGTEGAEEESSSRPDKKEIAPRPKKLMSISRFIAVQTGVRASGNGVRRAFVIEGWKGHGFTASELLANPLSGPWTTGGPFAILKIRAIERSRSHEWAGQIRRAPGRRGAARARGRDPVLRRRSCARYGFRAQQHRHIRAARARKTDAWRAGTRPQPENRTLRWRIGSACSKKNDEKGATGCGHAGASAASLCTRTSTRSCPCSSCRGREDESEPGHVRGAEFEENRWPRWKWARMTQPNAYVRALDATEGGVFSTAACLDNPNLATEGGARSLALFKHHSASTSCVSASKLEADWTWCPEYLLRRGAGSATSRGSVDEEAGPNRALIRCHVRRRGLGLPEFFFFLIFLIRDSRLRIGGTAQVWTFIQGPRIESSPHLIMPSLEKSDPTTVMTPQDSPQSATVGDSPV